ncbi:hypothetical protein ACO0QE_004563 [Hanseniaspora vineae]
MITQVTHESHGSRLVTDNLSNADTAKVIQTNTWYFVGRQPGISEKLRQAESKGGKIESVDIPGDKTVSKLHLRFFAQNDDTLEVDNFGASTSTGTGNVKTLTRWVLNATDTKKLFLVLGKNLIFKFKWISNDERTAKTNNMAAENKVEVPKPANIPANRRKSYKTDISSLINFDFTPRDIKKDNPNVEDMKKSNTSPAQHCSVSTMKSGSALPRKSTRLGKSTDISSLFDDIDVTPVDIKKPASLHSLQNLENRKTPPLVLAERQEKQRTQQQDQQEQQSYKEKEIPRAKKNGSSDETINSEKLQTSHQVVPKKDFIINPITKFNKYDVDSPQVTAIRNIMQINKQQENERFGVPVSEIREDVDIRPKVSGFDVDTTYQNSYLINKNKDWPARKNFKRFVKVLGRGKAAEQSSRDNLQLRAGKSREETEWPITDQEFITMTPKFNDLDMVSNTIMSRPARTVSSHSVTLSKATSVNLETQSQMEKRTYTTIAQPPKEVLNQKAALFVENEDEDGDEDEFTEENRETGVNEQETHKTARPKRKIITNSDEESDAELLEMLNSTGSNTTRKRLRTGMKGNKGQEVSNNSNYMGSDSDLEEFHFAKKPRSERNSPVKKSRTLDSSGKHMRISETTAFNSNNSKKTESNSARRLTKRRKMIDEQIQHHDQGWSDDEEVFSFKT